LIFLKNRVFRGKGCSPPEQEENGVPAWLR
jgi:hypothetical protein